MDLKQLWPVASGFRWPTLNSAGLTRDDYALMCERLRVELNCPHMTGDLQAPGPAEIVLLRLLSDQIGIGRFPNQHLQTPDVAGRLVFEAQSARSNERELTREIVRSLLRLRTDYGRVAQTFPVRWKETIDFADLGRELHKSVTANSRTLVTGPPGSGKSWALTRLAKELKKAGVAVGRHYCYVSVNDPEASKRILVDTLYANLTDSLVQAVPEFADLNRPLYASGPVEFQNLIDLACRESPQRRIVLIVDGLDHITRVRAQRDDITENESNIIGELANLRLPRNVSLVIGSQPGPHLDELKRRSTTLLFPAWTEAETQNFLLRVGIPKLLAANSIAVAIEPLSQRVRARAEGNPLYTWYLVQEIRKAIARQDARAPAEVVAAAPPYDEGLTRYYSHLIDIGQPGSEMLARMLACLDFGLTRQQLAEVNGVWAAHLLDAILEHLRPLLDENASQGGIRIYHDSFRRFVLGRLGGAQEVAKVLAPVITWLQQRGFITDSLSFRFLAPCLTRASRDEDLLNLMAPTFVSDAVGGGHSQTAIFSNLREAAWAAVRMVDLPRLAAIAELHKAAWTAFEDNLQFQTLAFGSAFAAVHGGAALAERLLFDGTPTVDRAEGLLLCQVCDRAGAAAPWTEYRAQDGVSDEGQGWEATAIAAFSGALRLRGLRSLLPKMTRFLSEEGQHSDEYLEGVLEEVSRIEGVEGLSQLAGVQFQQDSTAAAVFLHCAQAFSRIGNERKCQEYLLKASRHWANPTHIARCIDLGMAQDVISDLVATTRELQLPPLPDAHLPENDEQHVRWVALVHIHAYIHNNELTKLRSQITAPGWYPAWLRFVIDVFQASAVARSDTNSAARSIVAALRELASFKNPFEGTPRACDLYRLHAVIADTFRRALDCAKTPETWTQAVSALDEISESTSTHLEGQRGFMGPLSSETLASLLMQAMKQADVAELAMSRLGALASEVGEKGEYYSVVARHYFDLARAQAEHGNINDARASWRLASRALCGYGWRKDRTVWELFESLPRLAALNQARAESALQKSQRFADAVLLHTDGKETTHAPNGWFQALAATNPAHATIVLAQSISRDGGSWQWRWETAIDDILEVLQTRADPRATFLLDLLRPWGQRRVWDKYDRVALIERLAPTPPVFKSAIQWSAAKLQDDPESPDIESLGALKRMALRFQTTLPVQVDETASPKEESDESMIDPRPIVREPSIPPNASPLQMLLALRYKPRESSERTQLVSLINPLGYRLLELLDAGDTENVSRILAALGDEWRYEGAGKALIYLAEGFAWRGYARAAAEAYSFAFRGLSDEEAPETCARAMGLDKTRSIQVIAETYARQLDKAWGVHGIPARLTSVAIALREPELAFTIRQMAAAVIEERLWGTSQNHLVFAEYDPAALPTATLDEGLCYLIVARTSHPENLRRLSAFSAIAVLLQQNFIPLAWGIRQYLSSNALNTAALNILEAVRDFEISPYEISRRLPDIFEQLANSDQHSIAFISRQLLARIGKKSPGGPRILSLEVLAPPKQSRIDAILSLDRQSRVERLERIWPGVGALLAAEFDYVMRTNAVNAERVQQRWDISRDRLHPERPITQTHRWERELFESILQRVLTRAPEQLFKAGLWDRDTERSLLDLGSPGTTLHVARVLDRVPRPLMRLPRETVETIGKPELVDVANSGAWILLARFEQQVAVRQLGAVEPGERISVFSGIVSISSPAVGSPTEIPLGRSDWQLMWSDSLPLADHSLSLWRGPLVGLDFSDSYLGSYPFLGLSPAFWRPLGLARGRVAPLSLIDTDGNAAICLRNWWKLGVTDYSERGDNEIVGCELVARAEVFRQICSFAVTEPILMTRVRREPLLSR
jgi:hypothetical protein